MKIHQESETWREIERRVADNIALHTESLIRRDKEDPECDKLRGRIRQLQEILGWPDEESNG